ncbi:MAG: SPOR domain-containing protein [Pusillimonas sp.]|nr:SPOR domain-containing protein [Pusillimonas sp.]
MGLFSRDSESGPDRRKSGRSTTDSQASELRVRARRRLVGALVLVVAAVIVVPMLIDTNPPANDALQPIVLPPVPSSPEGQLAAAGNNTGSITIEQVDIPPPSDSATDASSTGQSSESQQAPQMSNQAEGESASTEGNSSASATNAASGARKPEAASSEESPSAAQAGSQTPPAPQDSRSDDGSVALALLEGRQPPSRGSSQPARGESSGSFVLQIAAYTTEQDANTRRDKLFEAGVTNAFVERASSGGKTTYRLRVGPFPSREAAQAAQTRLRALGYDNGFISSK